MLPQNASLDISLFLPGTKWRNDDPNGPIRGAVTLSPWIGPNWPIRGLPHTHTHSIFSQLQLRRFLLPEMAERGESVCEHTHKQTPSQAACVCSGWVSLCLAVSQAATGLIGRGGSCRTESEYTYYTEMLYEKPMWVWNIAQCKSILVDLISRNGHVMAPLIKTLTTFNIIFRVKNNWSD